MAKSKKNQPRRTTVSDRPDVPDTAVSKAPGRSARLRPRRTAASDRPDVPDIAVAKAPGRSARLRPRRTAASDRPDVPDTSIAKRPGRSRRRRTPRSVVKRSPDTVDPTLRIVPGLSPQEEAKTRPDAQRQQEHGPDVVDPTVEAPSRPSPQAEAKARLDAQRQQEHGPDVVDPTVEAPSRPSPQAEAKARLDAQRVQEERPDVPDPTVTKPDQKPPMSALLRDLASGAGSEQPLAQQRRLGQRILRNLEQTEELQEPWAQVLEQHEKRPRMLGETAADVLREALTLGQVETETFNKDDIGKWYDQYRVGAGAAYDQIVEESLATGLEPTEGKEQWIDRVLGSRKDYVKAVLDAQPSTATLAKEVGLASIPIYGTIRTWEESPTWARALSVGADLLFVVPGVGQAAAAARGGASVGKIAAGIAIAEVRAPVSAIAHPLATAKAAGNPFLTLFRPRGAYLSALENQTGTVRIPAQVVREVGEATAKELRDTAAFRAITGQKAVAKGAGVEVKLADVALQNAFPAAVHATPDIRPFLMGLKVQGKEGGLFVAPSLHTRFTHTSAFGNFASEAVEKTAKNIKGAEGSLQKARASGAPKEVIKELENTLEQARGFLRYQSESLRASKLAQQARMAQQSGGAAEQGGGDGGQERPRGLQGRRSGQPARRNCDHRP